MPWSLLLSSAIALDSHSVKPDQILDLDTSPKGHSLRFKLEGISD